MTEYHKIQTVFLRDPETKHKTLLEGQFAKPSFEYLARLKWVWTEKIDGTNVRVSNHGGTIAYGGRTDNAQMPTFLLSRLDELFRKNPAAFLGMEPMTLYGEGYGAKIQKGGGDYIPDGCDFILFDVKCGGLWLERHNVEDIADKLGIGVVPVYHEGTLYDAVDAARMRLQSVIALSKDMEGFVMRPKVELIERNDDRIITKIKHKDFAEKQ